jgi:hypothetical protein
MKKRFFVVVVHTRDGVIVIVWIRRGPCRKVGAAFSI